MLAFYSEFDSGFDSKGSFVDKTPPKRYNAACSVRLRL
jgi:hypothetical protein